MFEGAGLLFLYCAFAALYVARRQQRLSRGKRFVSWTLALGFVWGGTWLLTQVQNSIAALLVATTALSVVGSFVVLLAPVLPRLVWALAALSLPVGLALAWCGTAHG